eukprot:scaffold210841_cov27-Tisochrysis_lutea.AAC.2
MASSPPHEVFTSLIAGGEEGGCGGAKGAPGCSGGERGGCGPGLTPGGSTPFTGSMMRKAKGAKRTNRRKFIERKRIIMQSSSVYSESELHHGGQSNQRSPRHQMRGG